MGIDHLYLKAIEQLEGNYLVSNNTILVSIETAPKFVKWLDSNVRILGFEGFSFDGKDLVANLDCIADFSDMSSSANGHDEALNILADENFKDKSNFVEFSLEQ